MKVRERTPSDSPIADVVELDASAFAASLLAWYRPRPRPLRIRQTSDPWAILVSEVMAQQTQIERVDVAWSEFMARFPTVADVASASPADILRAWSGLGYNRRALNLQRTARTIVSDYDGVVPDDVDVLLTLPGIGPYTARAVAAVAYGVPTAAVDTNVRRVISRVLAADLPPAGLQERADALVDVADPATWTQAMMDLGATVCRARRADCAACPVSEWCRSAGRPLDLAPKRSAGGPMAFEHTTRWLRGRIIAELRAAPAHEWVALDGDYGSHDADAVAASVNALASEGLLEIGPQGRLRLPS